MWNRILTFLAWTGLWQPPLEVFNRGAPVTRTPVNSAQLLNLTTTFMTSLLEGYATESGRQVSYKKLEESVFFQQGFGQLGSLLQSADPLLLQPEERKTLFLNLYNLLTIQSIAKMDPLPSSTISVPQFWRRYAYQVGPYTLHLDDMEHGILRGNRPHPTTGDTMFSPNDPRLALALPFDHRIHGALNCGALSCPPLLSYEVDQLEQQLDDNFHKFCNGSVKLLPDNSLLINSIFQWFRSDFGSTEGSVLEFLAEQVEDPTITQALIEASRGQRRFNYNYDWTLNAVPQAEKVRVDVYFESLCSDSMRFFTKQLYPTWNQLNDIMDLHLIPFGKARGKPQSNGDYSFECQHGANECHGNKVMSCVQNSFPINTQVRMTHCMMAQNYPAYAGPQCARELGLDWAALDSCSRGLLGSQLLYNNGLKTAALKPRVYFIPTITINGQYNDAQLRTSLRSLKAQICDAYTGPPHPNCF